MVKNLPAMQETQVQSLGWDNPLKKGLATHSSILAWKVLWTEKPGRLQSLGSQRVGHSWATNTFTELLVQRCTVIPSVCVHVQFHLTLCDPVDCCSPGASVPGVLQARALEWVAVSFSRGFSRIRDGTHISCSGRHILYHWELGSPCSQYWDQIEVPPTPHPSISSQNVIYSFTNRRFNDGLLVISVYTLKVDFLENSSVCSSGVLPKDKSKVKFCGWTGCQVHQPLSCSCNSEELLQLLGQWFSTLPTCGKSLEVFLKTDTQTLDPWHSVNIISLSQDVGEFGIAMNSRLCFLRSTKVMFKWEAMSLQSQPNWQEGLILFIELKS